MRKVSAQWDDVVLVCAKCTKRAHGGFGKHGRTSLAKLLRERGNGKKGRKADLGVVEIKCQKLCPKHGVVAINAARPRDWLIVPVGADEREIVEALGLNRS
jgi:hypothetical protein